MQTYLRLACSFTIQTPYFLITDADTFFMRPFEALDLMHQKDCKKNSGVCDLQKKVHKQHPGHIDHLQAVF